MSSSVFTEFKLTRRRALQGAAAAAVALSAPSLAQARGNFRALSVVNHRTAEKLNSVYWIDGQYVPEAMEAFNYILRDWREDLMIAIDPLTIDIMAGTQKLLDTDEPFQVVSGYRSPQTNALLRSRSRGVARNSYHTRGMAVDLTMDDRTVYQMASAAMSLGAGGVGRYTRSKFIHVDSGPLRDWGR
ncbi:MAG: DUF882 domain-containing protein [Pseudomonadota bacterium]